jgi:hypothetical protein
MHKILKRKKIAKYSVDLSLFQGKALSMPCHKEEVKGRSDGYKEVMAIKGHWINSVVTGSGSVSPLCRWLVAGQVWLKRTRIRTSDF